MKINTLLFLALISPVLTMGQGKGVSPSELLKPLKESWPTYNGDYTGKRYSALTQLNTANVKNLSLAWMSRLTAGPGNTAPSGRRAGGGRGRKRARR